MAERAKQKIPWTGEFKNTHGSTAEADMELTHETTSTFSCLHAIHKTIFMIHDTDMATDMTLNNIILANREKRFDLSCLAVTK